MKKLIFIFFLSVYASLCFSQTSGFKYQAVLRASNGDLIANKDVFLTIIVRHVPDGEVYSEIHDITTNKFGMVNLTIGTGENDGIGNLDDIDWASGAYYLDMEMDIDGNTIPTSEEILPVPVALSLPGGSITSNMFNMDDVVPFQEDLISNYLLETVPSEPSGTQELWWDRMTNHFDEVFVNEGQDESLTPGMMSDEFVGFFDNRFGQDDDFVWDSGGNLLIGSGDHAPSSTLTVHHETNENGVTVFAANVAGEFVVPTETGFTTGVEGRVYSPDGAGVLGFNANTGAFGIVGGPNYGVLGSNGENGLNWAGYFAGDCNVEGTLYKGAGAFRIDHPLDPEKKYLNHSFVESPDMKNIYDGVAILDNNGEAVVILPEWFEALNKDFRYQLTCIGGFAKVYIAEKVQDNQFKIDGGSSGLEVSWQVTGIRKDAYANENRIEVEVLKDSNETGKYLHPEVFGVSETRSIKFEEHQRMLK